eukprot:TRINITY_DN4631_c0_g3_i2.p2 TRINITY_DN4631_c0_g3~~TRINITY_DN4631_c0_g3_i2.p2  ORF type:complete len:174 (+),score=1.54 TRINITY_DN4631_c0_g3_i2:182-703(+)
MVIIRAQWLTAIIIGMLSQLYLMQDPLSGLTEDDAIKRLCGMNLTDLEGAVVVTNPLILASICGVGEDEDCKDIFPMTEFDIPLECSYIVENSLCQQQNILEGDYCANSCGRCAKCKSTLAGCQCRSSWVYQATGETFNGCANPDNDKNGPWCLVISLSTQRQGESLLDSTFS